MIVGVTCWAIWEDRNRLRVHSKIALIHLKVEWLFGFCDDIRSNIGGLGYGVLSSDFGSLSSVAGLCGVQICGGSNG